MEAGSNPFEHVISDLNKCFQHADTASNYSDVFLVSSDGDKVPAVRCVLAARSPFFETLFFSHFKERSEREVSIEIGTAPLRAVVEYMFTGAFTHVFAHCLDDVTFVYAVLRAADYVDCPPLYQLCLRELKRLLDAHVCLAPTVFQVVFHERQNQRQGQTQGRSGDELSLEYVVDKVQQHPLQSLSVASCTHNYEGHDGHFSGSRRQAPGVGVQYMEPSSFQLLLAMLKPHLTHEYRFVVLKHWVSEQRRTHGAQAVHSDEPPLRDMLDDIDFHAFAFSYLNDVIYVQDSGWVPDRKFVQAFRHHAMKPSPPRQSDAAGGSSASNTSNSLACCVPVKLNAKEQQEQERPPSVSVMQQEKSERSRSTLPKAFPRSSSKRRIPRRMRYHNLKSNK